MEQSPDISINGFGPNFLPRIEIAADQYRVNSWVRCRRVEGDQSALGVATNPDLGVVAVSLSEPVHSRQHRLHFVADDVTAQVKRLPVNPFAMSLVGFPKLRVSRLQFLPAYQRWQNEFEPFLGQDARCLRFTLDARGQSQQLLGS